MPRASAPSSTVLALPPGLRSTRATRAVLQLLAGRPGEALPESEVEAALASQGVAVNRVTVYRLLDRLTAAGLLRRQVSDQRIACYALAAAGPGAESAATPRFECDGCHRHFPLSEGAEPLQTATRQMLQALALAGHRDLAVEIAVHGRCVGCVEPDRGGAA